MTDKEKRYYAKKAYDTIQQLAYRQTDASKKKFTMASLLNGFDWWMNLSGGEHQQIGKYLAEHIDEFEKEYRGQDRNIYFYHQASDKRNWFVKEKPSERSFLYHYTSLCAFNGIVDQGAIYLMNASNTNDEAEIRFYPKSIFSMLAEETNAEYAGIWREEFEKNYGKDVYFASMSTLEDDAAQWERYGDDGWGIAIAVDEKILNDIVRSSPKAKMQTVRYDRLSKSASVVQKMTALFGGSTRSVSDPIILREIYDESVWHKHPSFQSESEVRILTSAVHYSKNKIQRELCANGREYREFTEFTLTRKYKIDQLIPFVRIGPRNKHSRRLLEEDLKSRGLGIMVCESECPLR